MIRKRTLRLNKSFMTPKPDVNHVTKTPLSRPRNAFEKNDENDETIKRIAIVITPDAFFL